MKSFEDVYNCDSITLNVTNECNLSCIYCFEHEKNNDYMTKETALKIIDSSYRRVASERGAFTINLFGGEPFLNWPVIKAIVDHVNEKRYMVKFGITTNLTILTDEMIEYIDDNDIALLVSIDCTEDIHNRNRCLSYDQVMRNIKKLLDRGLAHLIEARMTIMPKDAFFMLEGVKTLVNLGINNICPMPVTDVTWGKEDIEVLETSYNDILEYYLSILNDKENKRNISIKNTDEIMCNVLEPGIFDATMCPIGSNKWCSFDTNGDVYQCHQCPTLFDGSLKEEFRVGNIYSQIDETKIKTEQPKSSFDRKECIDCEGKSICKSGCPMENLRENNDFFIPTKTHCDISRVYVKVAKKFRDRILSADNIRSKILNTLKENLKIKKYLDEEIKTTNIFSMDFMLKVKHFQELYENLGNNIIPSFKEYFYKEIAVISAFILAERGKRYGN